MGLVGNVNGFRWRNYNVFRKTETSRRLLSLKNQTAGERSVSYPVPVHWVLALDTAESAWERQPETSHGTNNSLLLQELTINHKHTLTVEPREQGQRGERQTLSSYAHVKITEIISFVCCLSLKLKETMGRCPSISPFPQLRGTALSLPSPLLCASVCFCVSPITSAVEVPWYESDEKLLALSGQTTKVGFTPDLLWVQTASLECEAKSSRIWMFNSDWCIKIYRKTNMFWWFNLEWSMCFKLWLLSFLKASRSLLLYKVMTPGYVLLYPGRVVKFSTCAINKCSGGLLCPASNLRPKGWLVSKHFYLFIGHSWVFFFFFFF